VGISLKLNHARTLAALADLTPFAKIRAIRALQRENADMRRALDEKFKQTMNELLRSGATWLEIAENVGTSMMTLRAAMNRVHPTSDASAQELSPPRP